MTTPTRAAIYARVSTNDQTCENQLLELRRLLRRRATGKQPNTSRGLAGGPSQPLMPVSVTVHPNHQCPFTHHR
jgi:hypothetical protein